MRYHLFTIWDPKHNPRTIEDHQDTLDKFGKVKWAVLHKPGVFGEFDLTQQKMEKLNRQIRKGHYTYLFVRSKAKRDPRLHVGLIEEVTGAREDWEQDELVPVYYKRLKKTRPDLEFNYWVTLNDLIHVIPADDFLDVRIPKKLLDEKYIGAYPCVVSFGKVPDYFPVRTDRQDPTVKITNITFTRWRPGDVDKPGWYVERINNKTLTRETQKALQFFPRNIRLLKILKEKGPQTMKQLVTSLKVTNDDIYRLTSQLNRGLNRANYSALISREGARYSLTPPPSKLRFK